MANRHQRGITNWHIGTMIDNPNVDFAKIAQGMGVYAEGPIGDTKDLGPALQRALAVVKKGEPALVDGGAPRWVRGPLLAGTIVAVTLAFANGISRNAVYEARRVAAEGDDAAAARLGKRAARWAPWSVNAQLVTAQALLETAGDSEKHVRAALERAERAIELSPVRASAREVRARARVRLGDLPGAYADLVEAARLYPEKPWYAEQRDRLRADLPRRVPGQP